MIKLDYMMPGSLKNNGHLIKDNRRRNRLSP
jgi:hypothetical protein